MAPDGEFDRDGCFSGSAVEQGGKLVLMYTGHVVTGPDKDQDYKQSQGIAVSEDGVTFEKWEGNPLIGYDAIPDTASRKDFRDPKVIRHEDQYYAVIGSNDANGNGLVLLYRSEDLRSWTYVNVLAMSDGRFGDNWECPDLFPLGNRHVFMLSPQRMAAQGEAYRNLYPGLESTGIRAFASGKCTIASFQKWDISI